MGFLFSFQPLSDNIVAENMKKERVGSPARPFKIYCKYEFICFPCVHHRGSFLHGDGLRDRSDVNSGPVLQKRLR